MRTLEAPLALWTPSELEVGPPVSFTSPRILLAVEDLRSRCTLASQLESDGFEVLEATDVPDLLQRYFNALLERWPEPAVDVIVSDAPVQEHNEFSLLRRLREFDVPVPVVLLSSRNDPELRSAARAAGAEVVLVPPSILALESAICALL